MGTNSQGAEQPLGGSQAQNMPMEFLGTMATPLFNLLGRNDILDMTYLLSSAV